MEINGREIKFRRSVWAEIELSKLCPGNNIKNLNVIMQDEDSARKLEVSCKLVSIMNHAYEMALNCTDPDHKVEFISPAEVMCLEDDVFKDLLTEAVMVFKKDSKNTVQVKETKKNGVRRKTGS